MRQISKQTLGSLQAFFEDLPYNVKLHLELATLLGNVSLGLEVTALQHQQDYLENMISIRIATPEIASLAKKIVRENSQHKVWERKILFQ